MGDELTEARAHEIMEDGGESMALWVLNDPGFTGTTKQLTCCGRCGVLIQKPHDQKRHIGHAFRKTMHWLCDDCWDALPE